MLFRGFIVANIALYGVSIATVSGKPSKVSSGKKTDPNGKVTVHVPATVTNCDEAISACEKSKTSVKLTQTKLEGAANLANTAYVSGADAGTIIRAMKESAAE
jgi:hypothetical protein